MSIISNSGVTISAVRTALHENTNDLGSLCKSNKINEWSVNKPVDSPKLTLSQPQDLYALNDGFAINVYNDPFDLVDDFVEGVDNVWDYEKPMGTSASPYRLGDFRGYNHDADMWFVLSFDNYQDTAYVGDVRHVNNDSNNTSIDLQTIFNNFPAFSSVKPTVSQQNAACLGFLMIAADSNGNLPQSFNGVEFYRICMLADYDDDRKMSFTVPSGLNTYGTYYYIPCITTYVNGLMQDKSCIHIKRNDHPEILGSMWYPLPTNVFNLTINGGTNPHPLSFNVYIYQNAYAEYTYNERYYTISGLQGKLKFVGSDLPTNRTQTIDIYGNVIYNNAIVNGSTQDVTMSFSGSIPTDSDECICSFTCPQAQFEVAVPQEDIATQIRLTVNYNVEYLGRTQNTVTQQDFIKVADIDGELDWGE